MRLRCYLQQKSGFTLVELMVAVAVFGVVMSVAMVAFINQLQANSREYNLAEAEIESNIALNNLIKTDISLAGYGLANDYDIDENGTDDWTPSAAASVDNVNGDELLLTGTALGLDSRATKGWSYYDDTSNSFAVWNDPRENVMTHTTDSKRDVVILVEPNTKRLLTDGAGNWRFRFNGANSALSPLPAGPDFSDIPDGTLAYGYEVAEDIPTNPRPFYSVRYYLDTRELPGSCAPGTSSLLRAESLEVDAPDPDPDPANGIFLNPLLSCVRNFQVAFGLDTNDDGTLDLWDDGGGTLAGYSFEDQRKRVKQVRVYLLVQNGRRDPDYQFPTASVRVGDANLPPGGVGEDVPLTAEQRRYRWRLLSLSVVPKNIRW